MSSPRTGRHLATGWSVVLALLVTAPLLLARGFSLVGDMVFVPSQPWKDAWLAADGSVPRAVPSDAIVSLVTQVLPGDVFQKLVLLGLLVGAGTGVAHLLREYGTVARVVAVSAFVWNPFVYERLAIGHWALLCGYAALPWVMSGAVRVRDSLPGAVPALGVPVLVAAWTSPTGGVLAAVLATAVVLGRPVLAEPGDHTLLGRCAEPALDRPRDQGLGADGSRRLRRRRLRGSGGHPPRCAGERRHTGRHLEDVRGGARARVVGAHRLRPAARGAGAGRPRAPRSGGTNARPTGEALLDGGGRGLRDHRLAAGGRHHASCLRVARHEPARRRPPARLPEVGRAAGPCSGQWASPASSTLLDDV